MTGEQRQEKVTLRKTKEAGWPSKAGSPSLLEFLVTTEHVSFMLLSL